MFGAIRLVARGRLSPNTNLFSNTQTADSKRWPDRKTLAARLVKALRYLGRTLVYSFAVTLADIFLFILATRSLSRPYLTLLLFLEGGLGLVLGVVVSLSSTPCVAKLAEMFLWTFPWSLSGGNVPAVAPQRGSNHNPLRDLVCGPVVQPGMLTLRRISPRNVRFTNRF